MFNKQVKVNIKRIDAQIGKLMEELSVTIDRDKHEEIMTEIDELTGIRCKLAESKVGESYSKEIVSGLIGLTVTLVVLRHETTDVITSKAFNIAGKLFRG